MRLTPRQRSRLTSYALVALACASAAAVVLTTGRATTSEQEARSFNVLAAFREEEVTRIALERGAERFELSRSDPDELGDTVWRLGPPYDEEAEPFTVDELLGNLRFASWLRQIKPEEVDRAGFGLDEPRMVVHVDMGEVHYRLRLGKEAAAPQGAAYLEVAGEGAPRKGVMLIGPGLVEELSVSVDDYRGRYVMPYLSPALAGIVIEHEHGTLRLKRAQWDGWRMDGMLGDVRVSREGLDRVLLQFGRAKAESFLDQAVARKAVAVPGAVSILLVPKDAKQPPARVRVGGSCPHQPDDTVALRLEPDPLAACVPSGVLGGFTLPAEVLVDRALFSLRPDEVEGLSVVEGERRLALQRKEQGFVLKAPHEAEVDAEAGTARLEALLGARGQIIEGADPDALGLGASAATVTVRSVPGLDSKGTEQRVRFGPADEQGRIHVLREQDGAVVQLTREAARALHADASLVKSRTLLDFDSDDVRGVEVTGPFDQHLRISARGAITLERPAEYMPDGVLAQELFDALRTLTAVAWVADEDDGSFGLAQPGLTATLEVQPTGKAVERHTLRVGRSSGSGYYGSLEGKPGVFILSRRTTEVLSTLVLDRSVFAVDPNDVQQLRLRGPSGTVELSKHGDEYVQSGGGLQLSVAAVQQVIDALTELRAEAAISLGSEPREAGLGEPLLSGEYEFNPAGPNAGSTRRWALGAGDSWRGMSIHYGRVAGMDANYGVPRAMVQRLLDLL